MRHPEVHEEILFNFRYNLKEKLKLLNYKDYQKTFGSVNASELMKQIVPKSGISLRASALFLSTNKQNHQVTSPPPDAHHHLSQHFKNNKIVETTTANVASGAGGL